MRALLAIPLLFVTEALANDHQFLSPNGQFEAYTNAANQDGTGMKLFLRPAGSRDPGVLLRQNNRWIDAKWSPDSDFLAVIDHLDGHISDVYVFGVGADAAATLLYHTPDSHRYDVQWEVTGWNVARREVILEKAVKHEMSPRITREKLVVRIGTQPLKLEPRVSAPSEVENEVRADYAIKRYLHKTHPWWTCEYTAELLPREGRFLVRRIVLAGEEKCSKSHHDERFDVVYDPERDKIVEVRNRDVPDLTNR